MSAYDVSTDGRLQIQEVSLLTPSPGFLLQKEGGRGPGADLGDVRDRAGWRGGESRRDYVARSLALGFISMAASISHTASAAIQAFLIFTFSVFSACKYDLAR